MEDYKTTSAEPLWFFSKELLAIREDLYMGDSKSAILKINDLMKLIDDGTRENDEREKAILGEYKSD